MVISALLEFPGFRPRVDAKVQEDAELLGMVSLGLHLEESL
jgi:hypothetical protein